MGHPDIEEHAAARVPLKDAVQFALDEARMILPGVQALFGFQLVAVFNQRFDELLAGTDRLLYLATLLLIATSCALIMAPAAYHRRVERGAVSRRLLDFASRCLSWGLKALGVAIVLDVYLVASVLTDSRWAGGGAAAAVFAACALLWRGVPRRR